MSSPTEKLEPFDVLLDTYLDELMATPDDEILDGDDPAMVKAAGMAMLDAAKAKAGKLRLASARKRMAAQRKDSKDALPSLGSIEEARAFLRTASNDPRFTLAARGLDEMSDGDVLRLYQQYVRLAAEQRKPDEDIE
jgi:hypothetical protein